MSAQGVRGRPLSPTEPFLEGGLVRQRTGEVREPDLLESDGTMLARRVATAGVARSDRSRAPVLVRSSGDTPFRVLVGREGLEPPTRPL